MIKKLGLAFMMLLMMCSVNGTPICDLETDNTEVTNDNTYMVFKGNIGPYEATMYLTNFWEKNMSGYYVYNDRPNVKFRLKCVKHVLVYTNNLTNAQYDAKLEEYTPKGNHTGTFVGTIFNQAGLLTQFTGTFTNAYNKKKYEFVFVNNEN